MSCNCDHFHDKWNLESCICSALTAFPFPKILMSTLLNTIFFSTLENDKAVEDVLASKGKQKSELISKMLEDEKYQREAFQALLLQQDHRALEITEQMSRIQNELASLTFVEMKKRDMKVKLMYFSRVYSCYLHRVYSILTRTANNFTDLGKKMQFQIKKSSIVAIVRNYI